MEWVQSIPVAGLVYTAFLLSLAGFAARDELWLRGLMLTASAFYIAYYALAAGSPLWDAVATNTALAVVNATVIVIVISERSTLFMRGEESALYRHFDLMTPGQFRRVFREAQLRTVETPETIARQGERLSRLYYVVEGTATVRKNDAEVDIPGTPFIGELAFLTGQAASATVTLRPGTRILEWDSARLARLLNRAPALNNAFMAQINRDLAGKVTRSQPLDP